MTDRSPITTQLECLLAISKEPDGRTTLFSGLRGHVWMRPGGRHVVPRVWERLWELEQLTHVDYARPIGPPIRLLKITESGLQRLWDSGEET